ncbi:MAG: rod shape-determining protein RodA [Candidatus Omnitrophica bacterium CG1_02_44_16]|nr:MAG: rod shape-determining protein RodA [Candidatus Omnitrophica bacterium CG1_02_44_16]PIY83686.1 MAG: rod shape-determining protein RodA [Candidatus Omnitrophica bacterium CG_4_10_14_0_8_um_filter_44_12]
MTFRPQKLILIVIFLILATGLICLYSSCHQKGVFIREDIFNKQLLWIGVGICFLFLMSRFDYRRLSIVIVPLYLLSLFSLFFVLAAGRTIMGAQRWLAVGDFSFQPSELGKFTLILFLANYFGQKTIWDVASSAHASNFLKGLVLPLGLVLLPAGLVLIQPDLGTAIVYMFIFIVIGFLAGVPRRFMIGLLGLGLALFPFFWHFLKGYQKARLLVFLNPNIDPLGAGYTVIQSKIAIGSGRLFGKGWMSGTQSQLNFLAERHTDFIFSVWGEEWGFIGSIALVFLYGLLILMILRVAQTAKDAFGKLFCVGVASLLFFHVFVNIAMNMGMCPIVGLPLPFMSYGGSSLVINLVALGIVLNIARQK